MSALADEVLTELRRLPEEKQRAVLDFARALARPGPRPQSGAAIAHLAGSIPIEDLELMSKAIADECERIDPHAW